MAMHLKSCFVCGNACKKVPYTRALSDSLLERQLKIIFVLRELLQIPVENVSWYLQSSGGDNPASWISLCGSCQQLVDKALCLFKELANIRRKYEKALQQLIGKMKGNQYPKQGNWIVEETRNYVKLHDYGNELRNLGRDTPVVKREIGTSIETDPVFDSEAVISRNFLNDESCNTQDEVADESSGVSADEMYQPDDDSNSDDEETSEQSGRHDHTKLASQLQQLPCPEPECTKTFSDQSSLNQHYSLHGSFGCQFCSFESNYAPKLAIHEQEHVTNESEREFQCSRCPTSKNRKSDFFSHFCEKHLLLRDSRPECTVCRVKICNVTALKTHMDTFHNVENSEDIVNCDICPAYFRTYTQLNSHKIRHHWKLQCPECSFTPNAKNKGRHVEILRNHIQSKHPKLFPESSFPCGVCKARFPTQELLDNHKHESEDEPKHQCAECGARFRKSNSLHQHKRLVHTERRFACEICDKLFQTRPHLNRHLEFHKSPDEWQFVCDNCGKRFVTRSNLHQHQRVHANGKEEVAKPLVCQICGQRYALARSWRKHMRVAHNQIVKCKRPGKRKEEDPLEDDQAYL